MAGFCGEPSPSPLPKLIDGTMGSGVVGFFIVVVRYRFYLVGVARGELC